MDATTTTTTTTQPLADRSTNTHLALNGDKTGDLKGSSVEKYVLFYLFISLFLFIF